MTRSPTSGETSAKPKASKRTAARLAAVQALYQIELNDGDVHGVVAEFVEHRLGASIEDITFLAADPAMFTDIVLGTVARKDEIRAILAECLDKDRVLNRLEAVMRALLQAAVYEMLARVDVPARVIIHEYVDIAHAFFSGGEPGFANGVMDRAARTVRADEMREGAHGGST
jgi:N utilization substance protein B